MREVCKNVGTFCWYCCIWHRFGILFGLSFVWNFPSCTYLKFARYRQIC